MGGSRGLIFVPEGHYGLGWKIFTKVLGKVVVVLESFSGKSHGGHLQLHPTLPRDKELEGLLPNVGGVKALSDLGGNGRLSYTEVV